MNFAEAKQGGYDLMTFRFAIRDVLFLIALVALAAGWWIDHQRIARLAQQKWEYRTAIGFNRNDKQWLNDLGDDGWELCGVTPESGNALTLVFKRPKQ
jgi:hypothetical protein